MFHGITFAELGWGKALLVAASGLVVTFMMLAILAIVIMVLSKIVSSIDGKKKALDEANIPHIKLGVDQQMRDFGQASTAIQAFADVL